MSGFKCRKCGQSVHEASLRGAYLKRVNEKGVPSINECRPNCDANPFAGQDDALLGAIFDVDKPKGSKL